MFARLTQTEGEWGIHFQDGKRYKPRRAKMETIGNEFL